MESFGSRLARLRKEHDITQNDIAERLNISPQAVSKWENDITSPDIDTLIKLSEIFGVSVDELVGNKHREPEYLPEEKRVDMSELMLRISVDSSAGDRVRLNLPMLAVKAFLNNDTIKTFEGNRALENIDLDQIYKLAEQGLMGELVSVDSGEDHVSITVEQICG